MSQLSNKVLQMFKCKKKKAISKLNLIYSLHDKNHSSMIYHLTKTRALVVILSNKMIGVRILMLKTSINQHRAHSSKSICKENLLLYTEKIRIQFNKQSNSTLIFPPQPNLVITFSKVTLNFLIQLIQTINFKRMNTKIFKVIIN